MTFSHKICDVDTVVEGLFDAIVEYACGRSSQVAGNILSPTTFDDAVLNGYDDVVVLYQVVEQILINARGKVWLDQRGFNSQGGAKGLNGFLAKVIEVTQGKNGHLGALARDLIGIEVVKVCADGPLGVDHGTGRNCDVDRVFILVKRPIKHGDVLLGVRRRKVHHVRNVCDHGNAAEALMGGSHQALNGAGAHDNRRILVERKVLGQLVVGALDEGCA